MPCTAATVGICAYLKACEARWNFSTVASSMSHWPAAQASTTCCRLAPTAKGAGCQMTRPSNSRSARATACRMPSSTSAPSVWFLEMTDRMATPGSTSGRFQAHAFVFPDGDATVVGRFAEHALGIDLAAVHRQGRARMQLAAARRIRTLGRVHALAGGLQRPGGRGLSLMARPAAMSSATAWAICCQPAACQVSNGPWAQPKPQRMARSRSRALSATLASCAAL